MAIHECVDCGDECECPGFDDLGQCEGCADWVENPYYKTYDPDSEEESSDDE